jgi:hypothetical protein
MSWEHMESERRGQTLLFPVICLTEPEHRKRRDRDLEIFAIVSSQILILIHSVLKQSMNKSDFCERREREREIQRKRERERMYTDTRVCVDTRNLFYLQKKIGV